MNKSISLPTLVIIVGPPAVGKMTVGYALAERTGLKLFHNHHAIELVLQFFEFRTTSYNRLVAEFRRKILQEVAASELPGLIFTYVWAFDDPKDTQEIEEFSSIFLSRGSRVCYVELEATQQERLRRNETEFRLSKKPSKRDIAASRQSLLETDSKYQLNSKGAFQGRSDYLHIENTTLSPEFVAERIMNHFNLPRVKGIANPCS